MLLNGLALGVYYASLSQNQTLHPSNSTPNI